MNFQRNLIGARAPLKIDLTSLVDVVFLLIIFLLVSTTFKKSEYAFEIQLPVAGTESVVVHTDAALVYIGDDGNLAFVDPSRAGQTITPAPEQVIAAQIAEYVLSHPDAPVRVRADKGVDYEKVLHAVGVAHGAGARNVQLEYDRKNPESEPESSD